MGYAVCAALPLSSIGPKFGVWKKRRRKRSSERRAAGGERKRKSIRTHVLYPIKIIIVKGSRHMPFERAMEVRERRGGDADEKRRVTHRDGGRAKTNRYFESSVVSAVLWLFSSDKRKNRKLLMFAHLFCLSRFSRFASSLPRNRFALCNRLAPLRSISRRSRTRSRSRIAEMTFNESNSFYSDYLFKLILYLNGVRIIWLVC